MNYTPSILPSDPKDLISWLSRELPQIAASINEKSKRLWYASAILTPTTLAADTNDYAPPNLEGALWLRLSASANWLLSGIKNPEAATPRLLFLTNISAFTIRLLHASTASVAAARFNLPAALDCDLAQNSSILFGYDITSLVWRPLTLAP